MKSVLEEWEIFLIVNVALRDGAFNMKKAFKEPGCYIIDLHCIIHGVQLVITVDILDMPSVKALKEEIQKVVNHAQMSTNFYAELFRLVSELLIQIC